MPQQNVDLTPRKTLVFQEMDRLRRLGIPIPPVRELAERIGLPKSTVGYWMIRYYQSLTKN